MLEGGVIYKDTARYIVIIKLFIDVSAKAHQQAGARSCERKQFGRRCRIRQTSVYLTSNVHSVFYIK